MSDPRCLVGDVIVSKFRNRWVCESISEARSFTLRNKPQEMPAAKGSAYCGPFPEWAERIERDGVRVWQRPTLKDGEGSATGGDDRD